MILFESGPEGGDVQIANEVINHTCHNVIFFIDPREPHAHHDDIRLLERYCALNDVSVDFRTHYEAAKDWIKAKFMNLSP